MDKDETVRTYAADITPQELDEIVRSNNLMQKMPGIMQGDLKEYFATLNWLSDHANLVAISRVREGNSLVSEYLSSTKVSGVTTEMVIAIADYIELFYLPKLRNKVAAAK